MRPAEDSPSGRAMPRGFRSDVPERVIPASRRPDGTMRKEIRVRAGYVNQDEVRRYTPGAFRRAREEEASRRQHAPASAPVQSRDADPQTRTRTGTGTATTRDALRGAEGAHSKPSPPAREPRTRSETRAAAAAAAAKSRASAWSSSSSDDDDKEEDTVPASARARHPQRSSRGTEGAEGVPSSQARDASASAAQSTERLRERFGDLRVGEARSRDGGRGRGGGKGGPRW